MIERDIDSDYPRLPSREELLEALSVSLRPAGGSFFYKGGLLIVALIMIGLWLSYLAACGFVFVLLVQHAVGRTALVTSGEAGFLSMLGYIVPLLLGGAFLFLRLPVLFPRPDESFVSRALSREQEPLLHDFVDRLCHVLRAPVPHRIEINNQLDTRARLKSREDGSSGREFVLTIGLPLVAGLNLRQMTGLLAQRLGHFSDRIQYWLFYIIQEIQVWLVRAVYEPDEWDFRILDGSQLVFFGVFFSVARFLAWVNRRFLWCLMFLGHLVSFQILRRIQFDADRYEVELTGSDVFAETLLQLRLLELAEQSAFQDLEISWNDACLGDDFSALIMAELSSLSPEMRKLAEEETNSSELLSFAALPSDRDRIDRAEGLGARGAFRLDAPASVLFERFDDSCKSVTLMTYKQFLGEEVEAHNLIPTEQLFALQQAQKAESESLDRCSQGILSVSRLLDFSMESEQTWSEEALREALLEKRGQLLEAADDARKSMEEYESGVAMRLQAFLLEQLLESGVKPSAHEFGMDRITVDTPIELRRESHRMIEEAEVQLLPFERCFQERLQLSLQVFELESFEQNEQFEGWADEADRLLEALRALQRLASSFQQLREQQVARSSLLGYIDEGGGDLLLEKVIATYQEDVRRLISLRATLSLEPYPFPHATESVMIGSYALSKMPDEDEFDETFASIDTFLERYLRLVFRIIGRLCFFTEQAESALGLEPLPEPPMPESSLFEEGLLF